MSYAVPLPAIRRSTIPLMVVACGVLVGNIYFCQPLLGQIAISFGIPEHASSLVAVATQVGYALGILLLVPLADVAEPRRLLRWLMALTALGLGAAALAPNVGVLIGASVCFAFMTVVPSMLVPIAASLVPPERRGQVVGTMVTGVVLGVLLSRAVSGLVAGYSGSWRAPYALAAVLTLILLLLVPRVMPDRSETMQKMSYGKLLASLPPLLKHRPLLLSMAMSFLLFGAFAALWSTLAFHVAGPAFGLGPAATGLFGLWGAPGALLAPMVGRLSDRWGSSWVNALAFCAALASFALAGTLGSTSLVAIVVAVNLLDFGMQTGQIANQTRIFAIGHEIRGRLNTIYTVSSFSGAGFGALAGSLAWTFSGWTCVCLLGGCLVAVAALVLAAVTLLGRQRIVVGAS